MMELEKLSRRKEEPGPRGQRSHWWWKGKGSSCGLGQSGGEGTALKELGAAPDLKTGINCLMGSQSMICGPVTYKHHLGTSYKCKFSGPTPDGQNQNSATEAQHCFWVFKLYFNLIFIDFLRQGFALTQAGVQ